MDPSALSIGGLELGHELRAELVRCAREHAPREACGLLLGRSHGGTTRIERVIEAHNLAPELDRFEIDSLDLLRAGTLVDSSGLELLGAWHSHPARPPVPSASDRSGAVPGWVTLIVSLERSAAPELRAWQLGGDRIEELALGAR